MAIQQDKGCGWKRQGALPPRRQSIPGLAQQIKEEVLKTVTQEPSLE